MDYIISEVSLSDPTLRYGIDSVLADAFGASSNSTGYSLCDHVQVVTSTNSVQPSLYLAAMIDGEVVGFNAFISHDLIHEGNRISCYQSCFTATSNKHRGKGIFQKLILAAHDILKLRGAAFLFGFPNQNSYPIFTKKLNYCELPSLKIDIINLPFYIKTYFNKNKSMMNIWKEKNIFQNDLQLIELKKLKYGENLLKVEFEGSIAWGLRRVKNRLGIKVPFIDLGGVQLKQPDHLAPLINRLLKMANWVAYIQVVINEGNSYSCLFQKIQPAHTNCLIFHGLNMKNLDSVAFNFFNGVRDVY